MIWCYPQITRANIHQMVQTRKFLVLAVVEENKLNEIASHELEFRDLVESIVRKHYDSYHERFQFGWVSLTYTSEILSEKVYLRIDYHLVLICSCIHFLFFFFFW